MNKTQAINAALNKTQAINAALTTLVIDRTHAVMVRVIRGAACLGTTQAEEVLAAMVVHGLVQRTGDTWTLTERGRVRSEMLRAASEGYR